MNIIEEWDEDITPERAAYYLSRLPADNVLRMTKGAERARVAKMVAEMKLGAWEKTHQGMLIGPNDELLDGAGRCRAVVASGVTIRVRMSRCDAVMSRGMPVDLGEKRHLSYQLQRPKVLVNLAQIAARCVLAEQRLTLTRQELDIICADLEETWLKFGGNTFRTRQCNNVAIQLAACAVVEMRLRPAGVDESAASRDGSQRSQVAAAAGLFVLAAIRRPQGSHLLGAVPARLAGLSGGR